ncbi:DciA family protein [Methylomonas koyamae]|uniref:DciA family protein n=1 Tax=Methylomonas koyamae TaxID=702114 RepID=UPI001126E9D1|nr:DciA family protein [Methylomonas koyamae]TPQ24534.1 hypothetical protein C2U68_19215 [Methylomonas koyamae]
MNKPKIFRFKPAADFNKNQISLCLSNIAKQRELLAIVRAGLPDDLSKHVLHCVASDSAILLYSDSANWASQIRFFARNILEKLHDAGEMGLVKLQVRIVTAAVGASAAPRKPRLPSAEAIEVLCRSVDSATGDDALAVALKRLGDTLRRRTQEG